MGVIESRLVIKAVDETAAAFASAESRVRALSQAVSHGGSMMQSVGATAGRVAATEQAIRSSGATMGAIAGAASQAAGYAIAIGGAAAVHHAVKAVVARQHEIVRMAVSGMSKSDIADATVEAAKLATMTPNVSASETLHMLRNARSIVGTYQEAAEIAGPMLKLRTLAQLARPGQDVTEDFDQLVKGLEIKGVTQDPKQFQEYMQGIAKGINVFGDTLKPYQYYEMFKYGRQATPGLSEKFMLSTAPTLAQELGGSSYGKAVSAFNQMVVAGVGKKSAFDELARLGLVERGDVAQKQDGLTGRGLKPGRTVKGWEVAQSDPNAWVKDYLLPALDKLGIKDRADVMRELGTLFQNQMAGQMVSLLATQQSRIDKDASLIRNAPGLEAADQVLRSDPGLAWEALKASMESLTAATLQSVNAASGMTSAAIAISKFASTLEEEKRAQDNHERSPAQDRIRRNLNKFFFGVDTTDTSGAYEQRSRALEDINFGKKAHGWVTRADELSGRIASDDNAVSGGFGSSPTVQRAIADRDAARAELARLREEARTGTSDWHKSVEQRGREDYENRMSLDGQYGRGHVVREVPKLDSFVSTASQDADRRAFGPSQPQDVNVHGEANVQTTITVNASSELLSVFDAAKHLIAQIPLNPLATGHGGAMNSDAAPMGRGGTWDR